MLLVYWFHKIRYYCFSRLLWKTEINCTSWRLPVTLKLFCRSARQAVVPECERSLWQYRGEMFPVNLGLCNLDLFQVSMVYLGPPLDGWKCHNVLSCCCISTAHTFNRLLIFCYVALSWSSLWRPEMYLTASTRANRLLTGLSDLLLWGGPSCASELLLAPPLVISGGVFTHAQTLQTWVKLLSNEIFQVSSIYVLC